ncbi:MAG TPA: porin [Candidatus Saccharimonadales bacterium]|nr:porin [Candidatus Saccharimonadales bacterium]
MKVLISSVLLGIAPALCAPAAAAGTDVDMSKGGVTFTSGENSLHLGALAQFRWTALDAEQMDRDTAGPGAGKEDGLSQKFEVRRMRVKLAGTAFRSWLGYAFQFELGGTEGDRASKINDAIIDIARNPLASLRLGQFKAPFSLQQLTSSASQEFVDRAITDKRFAPGRDQGLMLHGRPSGRRFGYEMGAFNGSGESKAQEDQGLLYAGRLVWDPLGEYKPSESAVDHSGKTLLHFGLSARTGELIRGTDHPELFTHPDNETALGVEGAWTWGRLFAMAEYFRSAAETTDIGPSDPNDPNSPVAATKGANLRAAGLNVQFGVMVVPGKIEIALRHAQIDPDDRTAGDKVIEERVVFGYFWKGHRLKAQADAGTVTWQRNFGRLSSAARRGLPALTDRLVSGRELTDAEVRAQMQVAF